MSFMGGSACATGANPLAQMAKQQHVDKTLQYDRVTGQAQGPRAERQMSAADQQILHKMHAPTHSAFNFDDLSSHVPAARQSHSPSQSQWAQEMQMRQGPAQPQQWTPQSNWAQDFKVDQPAHASHVQAPGQSQGPAYSPAHMQSGGFGMGGMRYQPRFSAMHTQSAQPVQQDRIIELDDASWEQQFKSIEASSKEASQEVEDVKEVPLEDLEQDDEPVYSVENGYDPKWFEKSDYPPDWENVWERIKHQMNDDGGVHMRAGEEIWERDFESFASSRPSYADYKFAEENQYLQEEDPFALGVALMDQGAQLSLAVLAFEAALKKQPEHTEAWCRLGLAHAQNEMENESIMALEQCVKLDGSNLQALLNLAISYTNEGYEQAAFATLERWLASKYPQLVSKVAQENPSLTNENRMELHERVTGLFIKAAQLSPDGANLDADVQVGLGVLFYGNEEYEKAVDCFRAALAVRPDDPLMWNRLGATLANSNKPEEAIEAYYKALELRPSFVRARYNVGVSCINIGCYQEAAQHLLSAISLHRTSEGDSIEKSTNLCETLRRVFLAMDRRDLVAKVGPGMDFDSFRQEFSF